MKTDPDNRTWDILLWQKLWRQHIVRRGFYEMLGLILMFRQDIGVLNSGYHEADYPTLLLPPGVEKERLGIQLYHRLVGKRALAGADVIEIGCGRGGGARFVADYFGTRSYWGTDASRLMIAANRLRRPPKRVRFRVAKAHRLPFKAASFDFGIVVETMHCLKDKAACLDEMARVLRPGGRLLIADFFYRRDSSPSALSVFRNAIRGSAWTVEAEQDWTGNVLASLEADSPRRAREIARFPPGIRKYAGSFASTVEGPLYRQLRDGRAVYIHFALSRRDEGLQPG